MPRPVWLLACGTFVNMVVSVSFAYTFLYLTGPRGLSTGQAGLLSGVAGAGPSFGTIWVSALPWPMNGSCGPPSFARMAPTRFSRNK